jgi:hypothetical protein
MAPHGGQGRCVRPQGEQLGETFGYYLEPSGLEQLLSLAQTKTVLVAGSAVPDHRDLIYDMRQVEGQNLVFPWARTG